jgi:hypothetical protein
MAPIPNTFGVFTTVRDNFLGIRFRILLRVKEILSADFLRFLRQNVGSAEHPLRRLMASRVRQFVPLCAERDGVVAAAVRMCATLRTGAAPSPAARLSEFLAAKKFASPRTTLQGGRPTPALRLMQSAWCVLIHLLH